MDAVVTINFITLNEIDSFGSRRKAREVLINVEHIGAIIARKTYTTLVVQGVYIHVEETREQILRTIGMMQRV